jgi:hypothetical protein
MECDVPKRSRSICRLICEPQELRQLFDLWLGPSDDLGLYLGGRRPEHFQVARQLIKILPSASIVEMLRYLVEDYWGRRSGWPDLIIFRDDEFFFAEVKSATDKLGKSQQRWLRDNRERLHFPFKLIEFVKWNSKPWRMDADQREEFFAELRRALFTLKFAAFASPSLSANRPFGRLKGILKLNKIFRRQSQREL